MVEKSKLDRDETQQFVCIICGRNFITPDCLSSHLKAHKNKSSEENQEYKCKLCHDVFPSFQDIFRHSKNHIENATHQVRLLHPYCFTFFCDTYSFFAFKCTICNKFFYLNDEIIDHFLRHKGKFN